MQNKGVKILLVIVGMLLIPSSVFATNNGILSGAWLHYNLDELSGTTALSSTGYGDGTLTCGGGSCQGVAGIIDYGYNFDGSNDYITSNNVIESEVYSVQAWVNQDTQAAYSAFFAQGNLASGGSWQGVGSSGQIRVHTGGTGKYCDTAAGVISTGGWHHIVTTVEAGVGVTIYVDGSAVSCSQTGTVDALTSTVKNMHFGRYDNPTGSPTNYYDGTMDEIGVWSKALSAAEVTELYNSGAALAYSNWEIDDTENIAYWKFEEASGSVLDATPNANDGTNNGATTSVTGIVGDAYNYDGTNDYVEFPDSASLSMTSEQSISFWVDLDSSLASLDPLIFKETEIFASTPDKSYALGVSGTSLYYVLGSGSANCEIYQGSQGGLTTGAGWQHVVITYDGATMRYYLDGAEQVTGACSISINDNTDVVKVMGDTSRGTYSHGTVDELSIWNKGLSAGTIKYLYNAGAPATPQQYPFSSGGGGGGNNTTSGISNIIGNIPNFNFNLTYDNATGVFNYSYNDLDGTMNESYMEVWYYNSSSYSLFNTTANSTNPGEILINASSLANQNFTMRAFAYLTDYNRTFIGNAHTALVDHLWVYAPAVLNYTLYTIDEPEGVFWGMAIAGTMMLMSAYNPPVAIMMGVGAMFFMSQFGFIRLSTSVLMLIALMGGILIWRLRR